MDKHTKYDIVKKLGEGGFGSAFLVQDKESKTFYVLKNQKCGSQEETDQALKEMVLLSTLKHPFLVRCIDHFRGDKDINIVMEYCEGGDLNGVMDRTKKEKKHIPEKNILRYFVQILEGLSVIHKYGVLHRDLKPANIFLTRWNAVKIGDFGISVLFDRRISEAQHTAIGTLGFLAPEVLEGKPYGQKADMYSLGCILYELCMLRSTYADMAKCNFPKDIPKYYDRRLDEIIKSLLNTEPSKRPEISTLLTDAYLADAVEKVTWENEVYNELQRKDDELKMVRVKSDIYKSSRGLDVSTLSTTQRKEALKALNKGESSFEQNEKKRDELSQSKDEFYEKMDQVSDGSGVRFEEEQQPSIGTRKSKSSLFINWFDTLKRVVVTSPASLLYPMMRSPDSLKEYMKTHPVKMGVQRRWLLAILIFFPALLVSVGTMLGVLARALSAYVWSLTIVVLGLAFVGILGDRVQNVKKFSQALFITLVPSILAMSFILTTRGIGLFVFDVAMIFASSLPSVSISILSSVEVTENKDRIASVLTPMARVSLSAISGAAVSASFSSFSVISVVMALVVSVLATNVVWRSVLTYNVLFKSTNLIRSKVPLKLPTDSALQRIVVFSLLPVIEYTFCSVILLAFSGQIAEIFMTILIAFPFVFVLVVLQGAANGVVLHISQSFEVIARRVVFGLCFFACLVVFGSSISLGWGVLPDSDPVSE